jgi:hypothetical protein
MKNMKYRTVGTVPNFNRKIVERGKMRGELDSYIITN